LSITTSGGVHHLTQVLDSMEKAGVKVESLSLHRPTLDDVFLSLTGHEATKTAEEEKAASAADSQTTTAPLAPAKAVVAEKRSSIAWAVRDSRVLIERSLKHIIKNLDQLLSVVISPLMFLLLFRYVFGGAINTGGTTYVNYLVAGILVQMAAFGASTTAVSVATDLKRGIVDRFRSLPMFSPALLIGHVTADLARNVASTVIMLAAGLLVGFRPNANVQEWLLVFGLLLVFTFAISWVSAIMGLLAKSVEAVQWMTFLFIFPLTFASSAFVPTEGMPTGLRIFAENQPVTHVIEAMRAWLVGTPIGDHAWLSFVWLIGLTIVAIPVATRLFRRHVTV
jgi:ABC-2 type transport system permease protein